MTKMKLSATTAFAIALSACQPGQGTAPDAYKPLPSLPEVEAVIGVGSIESVPETLPASACAYWSELAASPRRETGTFRIFDTIQRQNDGSLLVAQNLSRLPQLHFGVSAEGPQPIKIPTIAEFVRMAQEAYANGELSWAKLKIVNTLYRLGATKTLAKQRNGKVLERINAAMPGVIDGLPGAADKSVTMADFLQSAGLKSLYDLDESQVNELQRLSEAVPLLALDWAGRRKDLRVSLLLLEESNRRSSSAFSEVVCRYGLAQRLTAQILALKGYAGAPQLDERGLLSQKLPAEDAVSFATADVKGQAFDTVLNADWIKAKAASGARPTRSATSRDFLEAMRSFVQLGALRTTDIWQLAGLDRPTDSVRARLNAKLLPLAFGGFAVLAPELAREVTQEGLRLRLKNNDDAALVSLGELAFEVIDSFSGLVTPNELEALLLSAEQRAQLGDAEVGAVAKFRKVTAGVVLEGVQRMREGMASQELIDFLRRAGRRIDNPLLQGI
jgi:hypothetical protein